jgi:hypothetical protein
MYSVNEAAEKLKISEQHLRYLLANGEIEGKKISRDWVVLSLDYKRRRKPKRKTVPPQVVAEKVVEEKSDVIVEQEKLAGGPKFEIRQLVKVNTQDTPYANLSGRVVEIIKQQFSYRYWIEFSWPPPGHSKMKDFVEEQLLSTDDFFLMRGT